MTGFIVSVFPSRNRVSSKEAFEGLELGEEKPSRPVLRGPGGRKAAWLLGSNVELLVERIWDWPVAIASCGKRNYPIRGSGDLDVFSKRSRCTTNC